MKRVLVIGGNGFVGGWLLRIGAQHGYACASLDLNHTDDFSDAVYYQGDITSQSDVRSVFLDFKPDLAINVAAVADIDKAETNRELAYRINVTGAKLCAQAAKDFQCKYVWFSSDAVFSGEDSGGYQEESPLAPVNYYGETKRLGEQAVLQANPGAVILRISLVLGFPVCQGNAFLAGLEKS